MTTPIRSIRPLRRAPGALALALSFAAGAAVASPLPQASSPPSKPPAPEQPSGKPAQQPPQDAPKDGPKDAPKDGPRDAPKDQPKSLDDLLGLPSSGSGGGAGGSGATPADDPLAEQAKSGLDRRLTERELESLLQQALAGMRTSAAQLGRASDTGLATQRVQADVVAKLDQLIEEAKKQRKSGQPKGGGSSQKSGSQSGQDSKGGEDPKSGDANAGNPGASQSRGGKNDQTRRGNGGLEQDPPPGVDPNADQAALDESQAEWGSLPDRVRELIRQGSRDRIASLYQRLTEEYYRRMAEDATR